MQGAWRSSSFLSRIGEASGFGIGSRKHVCVSHIRKQPGYRYSKSTAQPVAFGRYRYLQLSWIRHDIWTSVAPQDSHHPKAFCMRKECDRFEAMIEDINSSQEKYNDLHFQGQKQSALKVLQPKGQISLQNCTPSAASLSDIYPQAIRSRSQAEDTSEKGQVLSFLSFLFHLAGSRRVFE